jgi:hypothetical protein
MNLYLYLNEHWHAEAWVSGGKIPIKPASTYKSADRKGTLTPDENLIHRSPIDLKSLEPYICFGGAGGGVKSLTMSGNVFGGVRVPDVVDAAYYEDDGLILSFSSRLTRNVANKMVKKACVRILSMKVLKECIDAQLGTPSIAGFCDYTNDHQRGHFLKSDEDDWQAEYRLFWPIKKEVTVELPPGIAELMCTWD